MAEPRVSDSGAMLQVKGLNVYYGRSHALQGVDLTLEQGVLSVVGRNGMGKTTLCKTIMGLVPAASGSIRMRGQELTGRAPADIARIGLGYVPQGRRLWRSLTVDEHLRMVSAGQQGPWTVERIYEVFPRLAERRSNGGAQLSGGEQQMLAIGRALLINPHLLIMDEPTEGLAPVIVAQVEEMLVRLGTEGDIAVLVIEQNIGVATAVSDRVAIMVNGRINRIIEARGSRRIANCSSACSASAAMPRPPDDEAAEPQAGAPRTAATRPQRPSAAAIRDLRLQSDPADTLVATRAERPHRGGGAHSFGWRFADRRGRGAAAGLGRRALAARRRFSSSARSTPRARSCASCATSSPKPACARGSSTSPPAASRRRRRDRRRRSPLNHGAARRAVFGATAARRSRRWRKRSRPGSRRQGDIVGDHRAGGSGGTSLVAPAMRALPIGVPKVLISTVASGDVARYVGPCDIMMMYSVTDVQGLNSHLAPGARERRAGARRHDRRRVSPSARSADCAARRRRAAGGRPHDVRRDHALRAADHDALEADYECLVFHATGVGGHSMEKLVDSGMLVGRDRRHDDRSRRHAVRRRAAGRPRTASAPSSARACPTSARSARSTWSISAPPDTVPERYEAARCMRTIRR